MGRIIKPVSDTRSTRFDLKTKVQKPDPKRPGWPIDPERAEATVEPTFDTWSPDDVVLASLALGKLRSAIDALKAAADKIHRARKCPDHLLAAQMAMLDQDVPHALLCAEQLQAVYVSVKSKLGIRHG